MPKGSMQLDNAIMYLQNVLVTIQNEISNEQRYTLLYKFIAKAHIHHMQLWYNEAVASKTHENSEQQLIGENTASAVEESKHSGKNSNSQTATANSTSQQARNFGEDGYRYPSLEFPASQDDLASYNQAVRERVELKYETLTKNVHFYLTYLFLETGDFRNAVKHGEIVLKSYEGRLVKKTQFTVMQYLAEAYCMLAQHEKAIQMLDDAQTLMNAGRSRAEEDTKLTVEMLTNKLIHGDKLASKTII